MWHRRKKEKKNNPKNSGHFVPQQRLRAAHALRSDQNNCIDKDLAPAPPSNKHLKYVHLKSANIHPFLAFSFSVINSFLILETSVMGKCSWGGLDFHISCKAGHLYSKQIEEDGTTSVKTRSEEPCCCGK